MPKIVDHDERRLELLQAAWRVIGRLGLEQATIRNIAAEAGYSNGAIAHYFESKDELIIQAHQLAYRAVYERADADHEQLHGLAALRKAICEALPLDEQRMLEAVVDVSLQGQAIHNIRLREARDESNRLAHEWWCTKIRAAVSTGELSDELDVEFASAQVRSFIAGISAEVVMSPASLGPATQLRMTEAFLAGLRLPSPSPAR